MARTFEFVLHFVGCVTVTVSPNQIIIIIIHITRKERWIELMYRVCWHMGLRHGQWKLWICIAWREQRIWWWGGLCGVSLEKWGFGSSFGYSESSWGGEALQIEMVWASRMYFPLVKLWQLNKFQQIFLLLLSNKKSKSQTPRKFFKLILVVIWSRYYIDDRQWCI